MRSARKSQQSALREEFQEPAPSIRLEEKSGWVDLWIEDRLGKPRRFRFKTGA